MVDDAELVTGGSACEVSREALELYADCEIVDLHIDTFLWTRLCGYDLARRHGRGPFGARLLGQADVPRLCAANVGGALWSITTNPFRTARGRSRAFAANLADLTGRLQRAGAEIVRTAGEYASARARGRHAALVAIQGGNAVDADLDAVLGLPREIVAVTLVHLTSSRIGGTSFPLGRIGRAPGLASFGVEYVRALNARRMFVDLAHIDREGFFGALAVHDRTQPVVVTHTGVRGVHPCWRNMDDEQLRAVAATGGVVGVMYEHRFLGRGRGRGPARLVVDHLEHIVRAAGEDVPALGSDWDGFIVTPADMPTCLELPRLVQLMLERGWSSERIRKILGGNFLRALVQLRG